MGLIFEAWPEFTMTDTTYNLINLNFPVLLVNVVDGNGATEVVAVGILKSESEENLKWFFDVFKKKHSGAVDKMKCCMSDKDGCIRKVFREVFGVTLFICSFHTAKIFSRQITSENMGITKIERENLLNILQKMIYACNEKKYLEYYDMLLKTKIDKVISYFDANWHGIRQEWVRCFMVSYNFLNETNNRTESLNRTIKLFCQKHNFLADFMLEFLKFFVYVFEHERNVKALKNFTQVPAYALSLDMNKYYEFVTRYAFKFIENEIENVQYVKYFSVTPNKILLVFNAVGDLKYTVTSKSCSCKSFLSMGLPCKHIFQFRIQLNINLYDEDLVYERWTKKYFIERYRLFQDVENPCVEVPVANKNLSHKCTLLNDGLNVGNESKDSIISKVTSYKDVLGSCNENIVPSSVQISDGANNVVCSLSNSNIIDNCVSLPNDNCDCSNSMKTNVDVLVADKQCQMTEKVSDECDGNDKLKKNCKSGSLITSVKNISNVNSDNVTVGKVSDIVICTNVQKRGRPKKKMLNAIGLPKKKCQLVQCKVYSELSDKEKAMIILHWLVSPLLLKNIDFDNEKIGVDLLKLKSIPCWLYNEEVDIAFLKTYMTSDAFNDLNNAIEANAGKVKWICFNCKKNLHESQRRDNEPSQSIICDHCLKWYHFECLKEPPLDEEISMFFCEKCRSA